MSTRVTSSRLIGRLAELAELEAALADAAAERPSLACVAGDSGVGKSRLLAELEQRATEGGALVLAGDCVDLGESELAYVPLVAALRPLARSGDPALTEPVRAAVAPLLPGLSVAARSLPSQTARAARRGGCSRACCRCATATAPASPVLLIVEDLHWADRSTRAALAFLGRSLAGRARPDRRHLPAGRDAPPASAAAAAGRARAQPARPPDRARAAHARRADGSARGHPRRAAKPSCWSRYQPARTATRCIRGAAHPQPQRHTDASTDTLRDALMLRVEHLSEPAQEILRLVAVAPAGRPSAARARPAASTSARCATRCARRSTATSCVADDDGRYRFRHALLREVVEDDLLPGERAALHLALARALEQRDRRAGRRRPDRRRRPPLRRRRRAARRARRVRARRVLSASQTNQPLGMCRQLIRW